MMSIFSCSYHDYAVYRILGKKLIICVKWCKRSEGSKDYFACNKPVIDKLCHCAIL